MASCRHNVIYGALNMQRGEVYAYPMCLQLKLSDHRPRFVAQDIICMYRPYLERCTKAFPDKADLQIILEQEPFFSVIQAYSWFCQVGSFK